MTDGGHAPPAHVDVPVAHVPVHVEPAPPHPPHADHPPHHTHPPPYSDAPAIPAPNDGSHVIYVAYHVDERTPLLARETERRRRNEHIKLFIFFGFFIGWCVFAWWTWAKGPPRPGFDTEDFQVESHRKNSHTPQLSTLPSHLVPKTYHHKSTSNRRLVVIGDVHGVDSSLEELLDSISFNTKLDHLILAGDMIDKGPSSHQVISRLRFLNASCVRGNHEDKVLEYYDAKAQQSSGHNDSALSTEKIEESKITKDMTAEDLAWIRKCPLILSLGSLPGQNIKDAVVVHAGLLPGVKLANQKPIDVMRMRSISQLKGKAKHGKHKSKTAKYRAYEDRHEGDSPWWKVWNKFQNHLPKHQRTLVIYGHNSRDGLNQREWSVGLDSGCVGGGELSALIIEGQDEKTGELRMHVESVKCKKYR